MLHRAPIGNMEASVRGGNERARYYVAGSLLDQDGTEEDLGYQKLNARVNLDYTPADRLTLGTNVALDALDQPARRQRQHDPRRSGHRDRDGADASR